MRDAIIDLLSKKAGRDVRTAYGSEWLCNDIIAVTNASISTNTVKRLTGVLKTDGDSSALHARAATLDIISRYLGFKDFKALCEFLQAGSSQFKQADGLVNIEDLPRGTSMEIRWSPDRVLTLRILESGECLVEQAVNSKLTVGDRLKIFQVMVGYPLNVSEVIRDGQSLGPYTAAPEYGVTNISVRIPECCT